MKKMITLALTALAVCSVSAQKANVDQAKKLSGKIDQIEAARQLIDAAKQDPSTANDPLTYYIAGKIEFDAYDNAVKKQMFNPNDKDVNPLNMSEQLLNGYKAFIEMMPLDQVPNEKGQVKPKYTKDAESKLNGHYNDYFTAGGTFYNSQKYFPEAYEAFMIAGDMPSAAYATKIVAATPDTIRNQAYFNAGVSGYAGNKLVEAAKAFKAGRLNGSNNVQNYIYEIACWQYMAQNDSTMAAQSRAEIDEIAMAGFKKFGMAEPVFINNLVNSMVLDGKMADAIALIDTQLAETPDNAALYGLRGFVNDRKGDDDASVNDYRKAASLPGVDFETLKNVSKKLFRVGVAKREAVNPNDSAALAAIKADYFQYAKEIAEKAKAMQPSDSNINDVIENIDYILESMN